MNRNFLEEAIASFDKALELKLEDADIWCNRGKALQELGQLEEAVTNFDRAIEIKPDQLDSWYSRGKVLQELGRIEEALTCFDKALEINSNDPDIWCDRGKTLQHLGRWEDALTSFDKTLGLRSNDTQARKCLRDLFPSEKGIDYIKLRDLLVANNYVEADLETARVMYIAAGREKEEWLRELDIDNFPCQDLRTINQLWLHYSEGKFGFSVQKEIYQSLKGRNSNSYNEKIMCQLFYSLEWTEALIHHLKFYLGENRLVNDCKRRVEFGFDPFRGLGDLILLDSPQSLLQFLPSPRILARRRSKFIFSLEHGKFLKKNKAYFPHVIYFSSNRKLDKQSLMALFPILPPVGLTNYSEQRIVKAFWHDVAGNFSSIAHRLETCNL